MENSVLNSFGLQSASSPPAAQIVTQVDAAPVGSLSSSTSYSATYKTGGAAVAIAATGATASRRSISSSFLAGVVLIG